MPTRTEWNCEQVIDRRVSLAKLRSLNVTLTAEGGRLRYTAPSGVMTADLRAELAACKTELLDFLKEAA